MRKGKKSGYNHPAMAKIKQDSRVWITEEILGQGLIPYKAMVMPAAECKDVILFETVFPTIDEFIMVENDPAVIAAMIKPDILRYKRYQGAVSSLFEPNSWSFKAFPERYKEPVFDSRLNLIWLDFCGPSSGFPEKQLLGMATHLKDCGGMLFLTHLCKDEIDQSILDRYLSVLDQNQISPSYSCLYSYKTFSPMCVIGFSWKEQIKTGQAVSSCPRMA